MKWPRQSAFSTSITLCMLVRAMHVSVLHRGNSQRAAADLKPENIVKFSYENDALTMMKLIDFDAAVFTGMRGHLSHSNPLKRAPTGKLSDTPDHHGDRRLLCTLQYFSPELARHVTHRGGVAGTGHATLQLTAKHDVWQFGIILARMVGLEPMLSNDVAPDSREAAEVSDCAAVWLEPGASRCTLTWSLALRCPVFRHAVGPCCMQVRRDFYAEWLHRPGDAARATVLLGVGPCEAANNGGVVGEQLLHHRRHEQHKRRAAGSHDEQVRGEHHASVPCCSVTLTVWCPIDRGEQQLRSDAVTSTRRASHSTAVPVGACQVPALSPLLSGSPDHEPVRGGRCVWWRRISVVTRPHAAGVFSRFLLCECGPHLVDKGDGQPMRCVALVTVASPPAVTHDMAWHGSYTIKRPRDFLVKCLPAMRAAIYMLKVASVFSKPLFNVSLPSLSTSFLHGLEHDHECVPHARLHGVVVCRAHALFNTTGLWITWGGCTRRLVLPQSTSQVTEACPRKSKPKPRKRLLRSA